MGSTFSGMKSIQCTLSLHSDTQRRIRVQHALAVEFGGEALGHEPSRTCPVAATSLEAGPAFVGWLPGGMPIRS
jgi:hypothetical protein